MTLAIKMNLDSAAFEDCGAEEVGRILASIAERIPDPLTLTNGALSLHDANGNYCGSAEIANDPKPSVRSKRDYLNSDDAYRRA